MGIQVWQRRCLEANVMQTRQWWNGNFCARYTFCAGVILRSLRMVEYFDDCIRKCCAKPVTNVSGIKLGGGSLGYNLNITNDAMLRLEGRYFRAGEDLYPLRNGTEVPNELWLTAGLTARLR